MVRHVVTWIFNEKFSEAENLENAKKVKAELEALPNLIEGIVELKVSIDPLPSSNRNVILNSLFESEEALKAYQVHPEHVRAGSFVKSVLTDKACMDYLD